MSKYKPFVENVEITKEYKDAKIDIERDLKNYHKNQYVKSNAQVKMSEATRKDDIYSTDHLGGYEDYQPKHSRNLEKNEEKRSYKFIIDKRKSDEERVLNEPVYKTYVSTWEEIEGVWVKLTDEHDEEFARNYTCVAFINDCQLQKAPIIDGAYRCLDGYYVFGSLTTHKHLTKEAIKTLREMNNSEEAAINKAELLELENKKIKLEHKEALRLKSEEYERKLTDFYESAQLEIKQARDNYNGVPELKLVRAKLEESIDKRVKVMRELTECEEKLIDFKFKNRKLVGYLDYIRDLLNSSEITNSKFKQYVQELVDEFFNKEGESEGNK